MKKILSFALVALMLLSMATVAAAFADAKFDAAAPTGLGTEVFKAGPDKKETSVSGGNNSNLADGGTSFCNKADGYVGYEFNAPKDGTYSFVIEYVARPDKARYQGYSLDSETGTLKTIDLEENADHRFATVTEELKAGKHTFFFRAPENFDDSAVKSCDIYGLTVYLTKEAAAKPAASTAAATPDMTAAAVVVLAASAAALIVAKKKH